LNPDETGSRARFCFCRKTLRRTNLRARQEEEGLRHPRIIVAHYGGPDALRVVEEESPEPKDGEVRVLAAGVSLPDVMMRSSDRG
jgi:hypothetical protein